MEEYPGGLPEAKPNDNQDKKKKRRGSGVPLRFAGLAELEKGRHDKPAKTEHLPLADLVLKGPEALKADTGKPGGEKKARPDEAPAGKEPTAEQLPAEFELATAPEPKVTKPEQPENAGPKSANEAKETEAADESEDTTEAAAPTPEITLPRHELEPVEFSGGEVIIHLNGETPVAERVIPLQPEAEAAGPGPEPEIIEAPVFHRQPQEQHRAPSPETTPATLAAGEAAPAGPDELPPIPTAGEVPPPPVVPPEFMVPQPPEYGAPVPTSPNPELVATKQELEDARYYAAKAGQQRGLVTGLLVGGAYEHFKHKRREKKQAKRFNQQTKQLEQARKDYQFGQQEATRQKSESDLRYNQLTKQFEKVPQVEKLSAPLPPPQLEQGEQLKVPEDHRLETSAWHSIEVDAKTGKAVENPAFQYGHEYYRERAQESGVRALRDAAAGEIALVAAAGITGQQPAATSAVTPPAAVPDATGQQAPSSLKQKIKTALGSSRKSDTAAGPIWPWIVALAVILVCLIALLA